MINYSHMKVPVNVSENQLLKGLNDNDSDVRSLSNERLANMKKDS